MVNAACLDSFEAIMPFERSTRRGFGLAADVFGWSKSRPCDLSLVFVAGEGEALPPIVAD